MYLSFYYNHVRHFRPYTARFRRIFDLFGCILVVAIGTQTHIQCHIARHNPGPPRGPPVTQAIPGTLVDRRRLHPQFHFLNNKFFYISSGNDKLNSNTKVVTVT